MSSDKPKRFHSFHVHSNSHGWQIKAKRTGQIVGVETHVIGTFEDEAAAKDILESLKVTAGESE